MLIQSIKKISLAILLMTALIALMSDVQANENPMEKLLPAPACATGWNIDGKVTLFDKESLFDRINGESELYFPYGFESLAYARYESATNAKYAIDADVYKMGSLIDAFGMFANYRKKDDADIAVGAGGTVSSSQVFFYQDRYFVRLQVTGTTSAPEEAFLSCARSISRNLPGAADRPKELEAFALPAVVKRSERYIAQSLLGYDFFRKGMIADAVLNNSVVQVFVVTETTKDAARATLDQYRTYLKQSGKGPVIDEKKSGRFEAVDPLYGKVVVEQAGRFILGVVRIKDVPAARLFLDTLRKKVLPE